MFRHRGHSPQCIQFSLLLRLRPIFKHTTRFRPFTDSFSDVPSKMQTIYLSVSGSTFQDIFASYLVLTTKLSEEVPYWLQHCRYIITNKVHILAWLEHEFARNAASLPWICDLKWQTCCCVLVAYNFKCTGDCVLTRTPIQGLGPLVTRYLLVTVHFIRLSSRVSHRENDKFIKRSAWRIRRLRTSLQIQCIRYHPAAPVEPPLQLVTGCFMRYPSITNILVRIERRQ